MQNFDVTKEETIKMFIENGASTVDFWDFYEEFGAKGPYLVEDVRDFLGH